MSNDEAATPPPAPRENLFRRVSRQPRVILMLLAAWSILTAVTQIFVNSGLFIDIHDREIDGALGGFAFTLNAVPLAVIYIYALRRPERHRNVFWLAVVHMGVMVAAVFYHWVLGTYSAESILAPGGGSAILGALALFQVFEPEDAL